MGYMPVEEFIWDEGKEKAAALIAVGDHTIAEVAVLAQACEKTIYNWKLHPTFMAVVEEHKAEIRKRIFETGIADRMERVKRSNKRWMQIDQIFKERAIEARDIAEPGHDTGLLRKVTVTKTTKSGDVMQTDYFEPEIALIRLEADLQKQAAIEVGQWAEKTDQSGQIKVIIEHSSPNATEAAYGTAGDSF